MANCKQCGTVFEAKRADARYCGDLCRQTAKRNADKAAKERRVTDNFVTDNRSQIVTDNQLAEWPPDWMTPNQWRAWMQEHRPERLKQLRSQAAGGEAGYKNHTQLKDGQYNRVSKPGDPDYDGPQGKGICKHCGKPTQSPLIQCCYECAIGLPLAGQQAETVEAEV